MCQYGPNAVQEAKPHLFLAIAQKFWAPVPSMLEATIVLEVILGKRPEAIIIGFLLVFNAVLVLYRRKRPRMHWPCCANGYTYKLGCCATDNGNCFRPKT